MTCKEENHKTYKLIIVMPVSSTNKTNKPIKSYPITCYFFPKHKCPRSSHWHVLKSFFDGSVGGALVAEG